MRIGIVIAVLSLVASCPAGAQRHSDGTAGIYSCIDGNGRTITADRLIAECMDRNQLELSPGGTVRRRIEPVATANEQVAREERARQAEQQALRVRNERLRERALLARYPTAAEHERQRADALGQVADAAQATRKRLTNLADERRGLEDELKRANVRGTKTPDAVQRLLDDNAQDTLMQLKLLDQQDAVSARIAARFREERARLVDLWPQAEEGGRTSASTPKIR